MISWKCIIFQGEKLFGTKLDRGNNIHVVYKWTNYKKKRLTKQLEKQINQWSE